MGVPIETKLWRLLRKQWKKRARKRASKRQAAKRAQARARKVAASKTAKTTPIRTAPAKTVRMPPKAAATPGPQAGTQPRGANRLNIVRQWERAANTIDSNRVASLREKNDIRDARAQRKAERDEEIALAKAARTERKTERRARRAERVAAADERRAARTTQPTVKVTAPAAPAMQRRSTPVEMANSSKCGARCEDGTPCENPSLGSGPCAAGHQPKPAASRIRRPNYGRGVLNMSEEEARTLLRKEAGLV